jgi:HD-like signal output (HDOD) protein
MDPNTSTAESATPAPQFDFSAAKTPADWIALLTDQTNFPFNDTIKILSNMQVDNPDFELDEAQQVVEETHLKNRILRVANNVYLNPAETILRSIQRATVILGLHSLRNLALGVALLSYFVDNNKDEPLLKEVALSIHTAVLTALLAQKKAKILNSEPLVVAGMMYSLGEMLFMFFGGENGKKYRQKVL